jgi:hypothetical protein
LDALGVWFGDAWKKGVLYFLLLLFAPVAAGFSTWIEVKGWIQAAFFGFQFGNLHLSLQSSLITLGVFALGLALTRFVQRWLTSRVFVGRHIDSGVHESLRIGIGYLGFVLAALAGVACSLGVRIDFFSTISSRRASGILAKTDIRLRPVQPGRFRHSLRSGCSEHAAGLGFAA